MIHQLKLHLWINGGLFCRRSGSLNGQPITLQRQKRWRRCAPNAVFEYLCVSLEGHCIIYWVYIYS